jgi:hypothetical protein
VKAYLGALANQPTHMFCGRVLPFRMYMLVEVVNSFGIRIDNFLHVFRADFVLHPDACASYEAFRLELIGVQ